jgi:hypothetical protein
VSGGVGVRLGKVRDEGESETESKADKIAESRGLRGAVIMPEGGGRATGIGEGMAGGIESMGGVSRLRCANGGNEVDSP